MPTAVRAIERRLTLPSDLARRFGHGAVDALVERLVCLPDLPVTDPAGRGAMEARVREPLPDHGSDPAVRLCTINPRARTSTARSTAARRSPKEDTDDRIA